MSVMITTAHQQPSAINQSSQSGTCEVVFRVTKSPKVSCVTHFAKQEMSRFGRQDSGKLSIMNKLGL